MAAASKGNTVAQLQQKDIQVVKQGEEENLPHTHGSIKCKKSQLYLSYLYFLLSIQAKKLGHIRCQIVLLHPSPHPPSLLSHIPNLLHLFTLLFFSYTSFCNLFVHFSFYLIPQSSSPLDINSILLLLINMASSTAMASGPRVTRRTVAESSESSAAVSPADSPRPSASSTSLSSLSEMDMEKPKASYGKLIDTYGNEFTPPDYTIKDIRDAIPKHCFERSALKGYFYILRDILYLSTTFYVFYNYNTAEYVPNVYARGALWGVYTFMQGLFATGLWVIAHECGHGAFSESRLINDFTGWVLHSSLLVPYFSWQISHSKHHKATGNMERDMVFVPRTREEQASRLGKFVHELSELAEDAPAFTLTMLIAQQLVGWPNYLMTNVTGHNFHEKQREGRGKGKHNGAGGGVNHFDPRSPLYEAKDAKLIVLSDIGLILAGSALYYLGTNFGWSNLAVWYFLPYLWVNHWLGKSTTTYTA